MPHPEIIEEAKKRIDAKTIKNNAQLNGYLNSTDADDEDRRQCQEYLKSKAPAAVQVTKTFSNTITKVDFEQMGAAPFEENKEPYDNYSPQWWFNYYWSEVKKEKLSGPEKQLGLEAIQALFDKVEDKSSRGFKLQLKADLVPTKGTPPSPKSAPPFEMKTPQAEATWSTALTKLLHIGFRKAPLQTGGTTATTTETSMLESNFVSSIKKESHELRVFWRADKRDKTAFTSGAQRTVDDGDACALYAINQPWHPLFKEDNKKYLWFRRGSADNDFYTVVSVTTKIDTAATFPLIDERRAYVLPLKALSTWTEQELNDHRQYLAEVFLKGSTKAVDVMIATPTNVFMLAINGGVVMDTRSAGAHYRGEDKGFPESGVKGYAYECFIGVIPIVRVHFGPTNPDGFKAYLDPTRRPELFYTREELINRFGDRGASEVLQQFRKGQTELDEMVAAWSSYGAVKPPKTVDIITLRTFPIAPERLQKYIERRK
jgi:hypothetical protein